MIHAPPAGKIWPGCPINTPAPPPQAGCCKRETPMLASPDSVMSCWWAKPCRDAFKQTQIPPTPIIEEVDKSQHPKWSKLSKYILHVCHLDFYMVTVSWVVLKNATAILRLGPDIATSSSDSNVLEWLLCNKQRSKRAINNKRGTATVCNPTARKGGNMAQ